MVDTGEEEKIFNYQGAYQYSVAKRDRTVGSIKFARAGYADFLQVFFKENLR